MKGAIQILAWALAFTPVAHADVQTSAGPEPLRYQRIVEANPFRLKPVPSQSVPLTTVSAVTSSDLKLTGVAASGGKKSAYFAIEERGKSPRYISLAEGSAADGLEVTVIDVETETVRLRRNGVWLVLSLKTDGVKSADQLRGEEKKFVDQHTRAHELHQQRERERVERERAAAEAELQARRQTAPEAPLSASGFISGTAPENGAAQGQVPSPDG